MLLDEPLVTRSFQHALGGLAIAGHQAKAGGFTAGSFGMVGPVDDSLRTVSHRHPIPQADILWAHAVAVPQTFIPVAALQFGHPERLAIGAGSCDIQLPRPLMNRKAEPAREQRQSPKIDHLREAPRVDAIDRYGVERRMVRGVIFEDGALVQGTQTLGPKLQLLGVPF